MHSIIEIRLLSTVAMIFSVFISEISSNFGTKKKMSEMLNNLLSKLSTSKFGNCHQHPTSVTNILKLSPTSMRLTNRC